jgi:ABC-type multidrug transport system fused ATPase/permease subunit
VIKFQAWESEFQNRIDAAREKELAIYLRSIKMQLVSSMIYTALPLAVAICTFTAYIALGHNLDVATALTSLALFEILRFPLFMLPMIITNLVEAKVSVDRIQSFLMEPEKKLVPEAPLTDVGVKFNNATLVYDSIRKRLTKPTSMISNSVMPLVPTEATPTTTTQDQSLFAQIGRRVSILTTFAGEVLKLLFSKKAKPVGEQALMTDIEFELLIRRAQVEAMEKQITATETSNESKSPEVEEEEQGDEKKSEGGDESGERILTLFRVSMEAHRGALFCIVGKVGSGKSSVLLSVLGDLVCVLGEVSVKGRVAYVGQRPFIQNSTLKDNILFGRAYDEAKYLKTLEMCALLPDLEVLPAGDQTEIGERGINLSGGQKARVGLARAVYADAEVVLLDDPLAAVDAHVGQHLFEHCITPLVQAQKCVVLVTNALQFIRDANDIIVLDNGAIIEHGNFSQLLMMRGSFHDMMMAHADGMATADDARTREQLVEEDLIQVDLGAGIEEKFRANSVDSAKAVVSKQEPKKASIELISKVPKGQLIANEDREVGSVSMQVYLRWAMAAGGIHAGVLILVSYAFGECISVFSSYWLSYWSAHRDEHSAWFYLGIYIAIGVGILLTATGRDFYVALVGWKAGGHLFAGMVVSILHAPMSFFDTTPMGRILNRFTKDVLTVDVDIPRTVRTYLGTMSKVISTILYISVITPVFLIALGPIAFFYYKAQQYFIKTSRELTRLDSVSRSPIYALFSETLDGLTTIRAYGDEERLANKSNSLLDKNQQAYFLNFSANCWLGIRLELAGTMIITFTALAAVLSRGFYVNDTGENRHEFAGDHPPYLSLYLSLSLCPSVTDSSLLHCRHCWVSNLLSSWSDSVSQLVCPYGLRSGKSNGCRGAYRIFFSDGTGGSTCHS